MTVTPKTPWEHIVKRALCFAGLAIFALSSFGVADAAYTTSAKSGLMPLGPTPTPTQCVAGYTCSVTAVATIVPGTTDTGNHTDEGVTNISLPFPVSLYSASYTSVNLSANGNAQFVSSETAFENTCLPIAAMGPTIFAYWEDLVTLGTNCTGGCGIYTSISGSAPNRIFNIEWRTFYFSEPGNAYFEIRLYEGASNFDVIIGQINTLATATIGVQDGAGHFTQCICNTTPPTNSKITFTTTSICGTSTPTATGTPPTATRTSTTAPATATRTPTTAPPTNTPPPTVTPGGPTVTPTNTPNATPTLCPINFTDVQPSDYFYVPVRYLYCNNVISGYGTEFRPYNNTSRGQLCKIVTLGFNLAINTKGGPHFTDVPTSNVFYPYVETLYNRGIVSGFGTLFRPSDNVSRGQLSKIVVLTAAWPLRTPSIATFTDVPVGSTFFSYIETAYCHGIISGYGSLFKPNDPATRGQISKIVYLALTSTSTCP